MIKGLVQGVGFRPFICRLADKHGLVGVVDNRTDGVSVIVKGDIKVVESFANEILQKAPPASKIKAIEVNQKVIGDFNNFSIAASKNTDDQITEISPDIAVCEECLGEMSSDTSRIDYPFINCTNCGPRFTIIEGIPYDRPLTSMKDFKMCSKCTLEYNNILDRRFHAQPTACNSCGPVYQMTSSGRNITGTGQILGEIKTLLNRGKIVALKGLGGYNILCDALNEDAVSELRIRKHRDYKPFAVMFRDISAIRDYCIVSKTEEKELLSWRRPILILKQKKTLAESVSNGLETIGAMLPYLPFHHLMFRVVNISAVVLTSANISDEPIITGDSEARLKLLDISDALVSYNRKIVNRADDSVARVINDRVSIIRRSRGFVPEPVDLDVNVEGILALGAEQKNSFCIGKGSQAILSQYIGDLKNSATYDFYHEMINRFRELFRFKPLFISCDLHPDYYSSILASRLSEELKIPVVKVQHHHAHIISCMAEHGIDEKVIGISLDGTGLGTDGKIWGGEFFIADRSDFIRFTHFDYIPLPGGDKAIEEPWRTAFAYLFKYFGDSIEVKKLPVFEKTADTTLLLVKEMLKKNINCPLSSGAGRLFDAVSSLLGLCSVSTFDSEAPMRLESSIKSDTDEYYPYAINDRIVFAETFKAIISDLRRPDISAIPAKFHNTIVRVILEVSERIRKQHHINKVILSGGVFQNKYLLERSYILLTDNGFNVFTNQQVPANDGGIALGQIIYASKKLGLCA